jgi:signal transduction histidine kinase
VNRGFISIHPHTVMATDPKSSRREPVDRRLAVLDELRQAERRASISRVASIIGHLIGTPLNVIAGRAALIRANPTPEAALENAQRIEQQVERLALRIRRLIDYLTAPEPEPFPVSAVTIARDALALYAPIAAERSVTLSLQKHEVPDVTVDGTSAMIVLTSLLALAARAAAEGTSVELEAARSEAGGIRYELLVPGLIIPQARIDRLDPPDNTDGADAEHLQVLSVCFAIARRHGGRVEFSSYGGSTTVRFECHPIGTI